MATLKWLIPVIVASSLILFADRVNLESRISSNTTEWSNIKERLVRIESKLDDIQEKMKEKDGPRR